MYHIIGGNSMSTRKTQKPAPALVEAGWDPRGIGLTAVLIVVYYSDDMSQQCLHCERNHHGGSYLHDSCPVASA